MKEKKEALHEILDWAAMQDAMQNSVVQVIAQIAKFNWLEPYKVEGEFENRGTGFFIDSYGHLVTNAHVVDQATLIWIHVPALGKRAIYTDVIGFCPDRDLALLKVKDEDLAFLYEHFDSIIPIPLGDSDKVRRTEPVLVLGYPLGNYMMKSATGVLSGLEFYSGYALLQITAPINLGNSGGPLINAHGEVIGIAIATVHGSQNIGFAIPINELRMVLDELYKPGLVRSEGLGIQYNYATEELAQFLGNPLPTGIYINKVYKNSLFQKAGVQEGDMLYEFDGYAIDMYGDATVPWFRDKIMLTDLIARVKRGDTVNIVIYRAGERKEISFVFEGTPLYPIRKLYPRYELIDYEVIGGMVIMQLSDNVINALLATTPDLIPYTKLENKIEPALIITSILPGSYGQQVRSLAVGTIIAQVNGKKTKTLAELRAALPESLATDLVIFKTTDHILAAMPFRKMLADEPRLARDFAYPLSKTVLELLSKIS